jgi:haloalkane dehalogenase
MRILRTPDDRFADLADWHFEPRYRIVSGADGIDLRFHFVDEGPRTAAPVLLLHGNPSWSYLHRHMINGLVALGHRVLAVDLMGLGRSDKPDQPAYYTLARHLDWMEQWLVGEDLHGVTLYCQDWGGTIGLCLVARQPERFARVIASNTGLPAGEGVNRFMQGWLDYSQSVDEMHVSKMVQGIMTHRLSPEEARAWDAPFPDGTYQASIKQFPLLIPLQADNPGVAITKAAWDFYASWTKPFLTVFGGLDPIAAKPGAHRKLQENIPGAAGQPHVMIDDANHFIQEDAPQQLVEIIDAFARKGTSS